MPRTLADMKARIGDEMVRQDLTTQIALAIEQAIERYQHERFHWTRRLDYTIPAVVGTDNYELDSRVTDLVSVRWENGSTVNDLRQMTWDEYRWRTRQTPDNGDPTHAVVHGDVLYVWPPPATDGDAVQFVLDYWKSWNAPADDSTDTNDWMNEGEALIRAAAKAILYADVDPDDAQFAKFSAIEQRELARLRTRSSRRLGHHRQPVRPYDFEPSYACTDYR